MKGIGLEPGAEEKARLSLAGLFWAALVTNALLGRGRGNGRVCDGLVREITTKMVACKVIGLSTAGAIFGELSRHRRLL